MNKKNVYISSPISDISKNIDILSHTIVFQMMKEDGICEPWSPVLFSPDRQYCIDVLKSGNVDYLIRIDSSYGAYSRSESAICDDDVRIAKENGIHTIVIGVDEDSDGNLLVDNGDVLIELYRRIFFDSIDVSDDSYEIFK